MTKALALVLVALSVTACGGSSATAPSGTTSPVSMTGTWSGNPSDSSSAMGPGSLMGQGGMGTMTWPLTQTGSAVTGSMTFAGMQGRSPGSFVGAMSGDEMTFTLEMPIASMMSSGCTARATGTARVDGMRMTMTGTYSGSNSCTGSFTNGEMTMARR